MKSRKGFTLIELMIVVVIVAVLAAIVVPLLISRVEKARYSEGKAIASQIATSVRAWAVESEVSPLPVAPSLTLDLGFKSNELDAKWFRQNGPMAVTGVSLDPVTGTMNYIITLPVFDANKLTKGPVVLECAANVTTFTSPTGL